MVDPADKARPIEKHTGSTERWTFWIGVCVLAALFAYAYRGMFDNGFHFDDAVNIELQEPIHVRELSYDALRAAAFEAHLPRRPLANLSLAIDWYRGHGDVAPFLQTNFAIHVINALLVYLLLLRILSSQREAEASDRLAALIGAGLWAVHPIQVQAVTYVVQRMASLATLFVLLSCLAYLAGRRRRGATALLYYAACCGGMMLGVASKEIALITPVLLLLLELGVVRQATRRAERLTRMESIALATPVVLFLLVAALYLAGWSGVSFIGGYDHRDYTAYERLISQPRVFFLYLSQLAWPYWGAFSIEHDVMHSTGLVAPLTTLPSILAMLAVTGASAYYFVTRRSLAAFCVLWVLAGLVIEGTIVPLELVFEHRMYLPSVGLMGLLALKLSPHLRSDTPRIWVRHALVCVVLVVVAWNTSRLVRVWRDDISLNEQAVKVSPYSARAHSNLGKAYWEAGRVFDAIQAYEKAVVLKPSYEIALHNLGRAYQSVGEREKAVRIYQKLLEIDPTNADYAYSVGIHFMEAGDYKHAAQFFRQTLRYRPNHQQALMFLDYVERKAPPGDR